jgi:hypothetical protein
MTENTRHHILQYSRYTAKTIFKHAKHSAGQITAQCSKTHYITASTTQVTPHKQGAPHYNKHNTLKHTPCHTQHNTEHKFITQGTPHFSTAQHSAYHVTACKAHLTTLYSKHSTAQCIPCHSM